MNVNIHHIEYNISANKPPKATRNILLNFFAISITVFNIIDENGINGLHLKSGRKLLHLLRHINLWSLIEPHTRSKIEYKI
jgi:hypothetical protein